MYNSLRKLSYTLHIWLSVGVTDLMILQGSHSWEKNPGVFQSNFRIFQCF